MSISLAEEFQKDTGVEACYYENVLTQWLALELLKERQKNKNLSTNTVFNFRNWLLYLLNNEKKDVEYIIDKFDETFNIPEQS